MESSKNNKKELGFKEKYFKILFEVESVVQDGKKYNIIDRFFHYSIEETRMIKDIDTQNLIEEYKNDILKEINSVFNELKINLIYKIKYCFGLHSFSSYLNSSKTVIFDNPSLLGISPFIFDQIEWEYIIVNEIKKSGYDIASLYNIEKMIINNLEEALFRLNKEEFVCLLGWDIKRVSTENLFSLIRTRMFETVKKSKSPELVIKEIIKKNTVVNSSRIVLTGNFTTGKLIDKIIEGFGSKDIKLSNDEINYIKSFVSQNFKNSKGKNLGFQEIKNKTFFNLHKRLLKNILVTNRKSLRCEQKDISRIINNTLPELGELKTIENY